MVTRTELHRNRVTRKPTALMVPAELVAAMQSGRPELLLASPARALNAEETAGVYTTIKTLIEENNALKNKNTPADDEIYANILDALTGAMGAVFEHRRHNDQRGARAAAQRFAGCLNKATDLATDAGFEFDGGARGQG